jgi:hypothetical protein
MADRIKTIPIAGNDQEKLKALENNLFLLERALNAILDRLKKAGI